LETVKAPDGKVLCLGVITHSGNIAEHPELICDRILRFANLVGRENIIAAADCGFSSQALCKTEVYHAVSGRTSRALRQGADVASRKLWKS
jgi:5-methyltetrahydropteroyltriglutamate--homocysteine methyltransferase